MWSLEPIGRREHSAPLKISFRGSLAGRFAELKHEDRSDFIEELFKSSDLDIMAYVEDGSLVVGRLSERGCFFPDW